MSTRDEFTRVYVQKLQEAMQRHPDEYMDADKPDAPARVVEKMVRAIEQNGARSVNLGHALKATLRVLNLPTTYAGLEQARNSWVSVGLGDVSPSLYEELKAAGIKMDSHESDLYVQETPAVRGIIAQFPMHAKNATRFKDRRDGKIWIDVPFAYDPWWNKKAKRR